MNSTFEYIALIQREREAEITTNHVARIAACFRACCSPNLFDRLARTLRRQPTPC